MIDLKLINQETLKRMFARGASRIVSQQGSKINSANDQLVLIGAKIGCGVCAGDFNLPDPLKLCVRGYLDAPSAHLCKCPNCGSENEIRGHITESPDKGQECWVLTTLRSFPSKFAGSPYLGWPILMVDKVYVEPQG